MAEVVDLVVSLEDPRLGEQLKGMEQLRAEAFNPFPHIHARLGTSKISDAETLTIVDELYCDDDSFDFCLIDEEELYPAPLLLC